MRFSFGAVPDLQPWCHRGGETSTILAAHRRGRHLLPMSTPRFQSRRTPERHRAVRRVLWVTFGLNLVLAAVKVSVGVTTGTLSIVAEAVQSSVDAGNNLLALVLARVAAQDPDAEHPYGHAKFETIGALGVVAFLSVTVFELATRAVERLVSGAGNPQASALTVGVMLASVAVSAAVSRYEADRGRALGSDLLLADAAHTRTDVYAALAVLAGLGLVAVGQAWADPVMTLVVAALIARTGWQIVRDTVPVLVDERAVSEDTLRRIVLATPGVRGCREVRSRGRPGEVFAELTICVAGEIDVRRAHAIADEVETRVARQVGAREVVVHIEPEE